MSKKHLLYAVINTFVNVFFFMFLIIMMFTELINHSIVLMVLSPLGLQPEPGVIFDFISFALGISPFVFLSSIIGSWIAYFKNSLKYFKLFVILSWGYILLIVIIYLILWLSI